MGIFGSSICGILFLLFLFCFFFGVRLVMMMVMIQVCFCCTNFGEEEVEFVFGLLATLLGV